MSTEEIKHLQVQLEETRVDADARVAAVKEQLSEAKTKAKAVIQRNIQQANQRYQQLENRFNDSEKQLVTLHDKLNQYEILQKQYQTLKEESEQLKQNLIDTSKTSTSEDQSVSELWQVITEKNNHVEDLTQQLEKLKHQLKQKDEQYESSIKAVVEQKGNSDEKLSQAEARIAQLESNFKQSEINLQQERERNIQATKSTSSSNDNSDEQIKVLEAKVSEMERLVASKQAEIGKVREKARTYLREINAEKRDMETKMKEQVEQLQTELQDEKDKLQEIEKKGDDSSKELDSCLAVIREKQKNIQMLKMTISSIKTAFEKATMETNALREEFSRYKERARIALNEKETQLQATDNAVGSATASLREELQSNKKTLKKLEEDLAQASTWKTEYESMKERATRAEAAVDLLRKDTTNSSPISYTQVDVLEEKLSTIESQLTAANSAVEDVEARHNTTKMRLEAAEKALRGAELRSQENDRISSNTIEKLQEQVKSLQVELGRAQESAASAQRTAAAAARAMTMTNGNEPIAKDDSNISNATELSTKEERSLELDGIEKNDFDSSFEVSTLKGGATLAAALEHHSGQYRFDDNDSSYSIVADSSSANNEVEVKAKEKQISLLTAQVAELGALLDDVQEESQIRTQQTELLKSEVRNLDAKLAAAEKLQNGTPFSYLRTIVVRYLETDDATLLPVIANVLSFTEDEVSKVKERRGSVGTPTTTGSNRGSSYFSLPFLGSR